MGGLFIAASEERSQLFPHILKDFLPAFAVSFFFFPPEADPPWAEVFPACAGRFSNILNFSAIVTYSVLQNRHFASSSVSVKY